MLTVLVLTPDFPPGKGGIETLLHRLVSNWRRCRARVITLDHSGAAEFDAAQPFPVIRVRGRSHRTSIARLNAAALQYGLRHRPDVVVSAHVVTAPGAQLVGKARRVPVLQYLYAVEATGRPGLTSFAVANADAVVAISRHTRGLARAAGASEARVTVIPPGVDLPRNEAPRESERPTIVTVAQLKYRYKGHDVVARALPIIAAAVPGVEWVIVGDGPLRPYLEALVRANGVAGGVRFVGSVADVERDSWLRRADVMVMPSRIPAYGVGGEGFGIAYSEASARGVPVVAGDVGGARDAVADGITGLLVDPTDHLAVADAVTKLLGDAELRRRMGEAGRRRARELEWPRVARRVEEVLVRLAELGRGSESPLSDDLAFHR